ncbi:MAG: ATP-binding cassette domain-containing protein [Gemmatimonadetes bacterium]|nr:ATP-binding cassette domain-containing protein [Gemmatimonadota bacterium]
MIGGILRRPVMVCMLLLGACMLGVVSHQRLAVELIPFAELPLHIVQIRSQRDAEPAYLEHQAVIPIESAIATLEGIERIEASVQQREATLYIYYTPSTNQKYSYLRLQEEVAAAQMTLGDEFFVSAFKIDTEQMSNRFMGLQARGAGSLDQIRQVVDAKVLPQLESIDGVASVSIFGGRQRSVEVELDEDGLHSHGLTMADVSNRIAQAARPRRFLGHVEDGRQRAFVHLVSEFDDIDALAQTVIGDDGSLKLGQLARIQEGGADRQSISLVNGMESIAISLIRDQAVNLIDLSHATRDVVDQLNRDIAGDGIELVIQTDSAEPIEENIESIQQLALVGGVLAIAVLWVFLRNLRLVAVVAAAVPVSVLIALNFFYAFDISLNTLSLVGIAIAVGMLLDNSVVVLENIYRQLARGIEPFAAVVAGVREVWRAVAAATLTTVCVFLPFVFSENFLVGTLGRNVGISVVSTLLVSLVVAVLLIPVFAYRLFRTRESLAAVHTAHFHRVSQRHRLVQIYSLLLKSCLRYPTRAVVISTLLFFVSVLLCLGVSVNAGQDVELETFDLYATLPGGTTLEVVDEIARELDERMQRVEELAERRIDVQPDLLHLSLDLKEDFQQVAGRNLASIKSDMQQDLWRAYQGMRFSFSQPVGRSGGGGGRGGGGGFSGGQAFQRLLGIGSSSEHIAIRGSDLSMLRRIADDLKYNLERQSTISYAYVQVSGGEPQIDLHLDHAALSYFGVDAQAINGALTDLQRQVETAAQLRPQDADEIDIVLKGESREDVSQRVEDLYSLQVSTNGGGTVALSQLTDLRYSDGYGSYDRVNQEKELRVGYHFHSEIKDSKDLLDEARATVDLLAGQVNLPSGVAIEVVHDETDLTEFYFLIGAAIILIYMILASVFESLVAPLAMMITLPLATVGAFWGLILTGNSIFNANALVGFLILLGVVVNNGIMLIDYARMLQRRGYRLGRALLTAGQIRVRPIAITALTTVLAMVPLAMGEAEYVAMIGVPFAIAVIGGLAAGTVFSLVLVPTVYYGLEQVVEWGRELSTTARLANLAIMGTGLWLVTQYVDSTFWKFADGTALLGLVPGLTWFVQSSLRRSQADLIPADQALHISIANVVKEYDEPSRFRRQWRRGERQLAHDVERGRVSAATTSSTGGAWAWQLPLFGFHAYFTYLHLDHLVWMMLFSVGLYIHLRILLSAHLAAFNGQRRRDKLIRFGYGLVIWLLPAMHMAWWQNRWEIWPATLIAGAFWYLGVAIYRGSQKLYRGEVNVDSIVGRFRRSRSGFYRLIGAIPVIGRRKRPFTALQQVSLEIGSGMFGLIGPNGAGKTTLMRIICGVLSQSRGRVKINGHDQLEQREELQALIGYLPQEFGTYENMTAYQFLDYQALLKGKWDPQERQEVVEAAISRVHLDDSRDRKIGGFSGGMKQRVGIAQTLLHLPRILVVDEPTAGLDPRERIRFRNLLSELARDRIVIFSTHIIEDISSSCNRVAVLGGGQVRFDGSPLDMVERTRGVVWQAQVDEERFAQLRETERIVHHMRDGEQIRVRLLSANQPWPDAQAVTPTLEDAYLWLLDGEAA